jgi:hypothetical protein
MDPFFLDGLIQYIKQSNLREREYYDDQEFLLHFARNDSAHETLIQHLPITLPNGNVVMLPSDLYFFFESESLATCSPMFLTQVGIVVTEDTDVLWQDMHEMQMKMFRKKHSLMTDLRPNENYMDKELKGIEKNFFFSFLKKLEAIEAIKSWPLWNMKSLIK